eukprot:759243-Hanusia_phi.AAC.1
MAGRQTEKRVEDQDGCKPAGTISPQINDLPPPPLPPHHDDCDNRHLHHNHTSSFLFPILPPPFLFLIPLAVRIRCPRRPCSRRAYLQVLVLVLPLM